MASEATEILPVIRLESGGSGSLEGQLDATVLEKRKDNPMASISNLAFELLSHIFVLTGYKTPEELAILMQVCHYWREAVISTAELWTRIPCDRNRQDQRNLHLERSTIRPLDVSLELYTETLHPIDDESPVHVLDHLPRIETLRVEFRRKPRNLALDPEDQDELSWGDRLEGHLEPKFDTFGGLCRSPAPVLRVLELRRSNQFQVPTAKWIPNMFLGAKLHHLKLHGIGIAWNSHLISSSLTYLYINSSRAVDDNFTPQEIRKFLAPLDRLEHLHLEDVMRLEIHQPDWSKVERVHLPSVLKTLTIRNMWLGYGVCSFFAGVTFPGTVDVLNVFDRYEQSTPMLVRLIKEACRDWEAFWSGDIRALHVGHPDNLDYISTISGIRGITEAGAEKLVLEIPASTTPELCSALYLSGAHRIRSVRWGADARDAIHRAFLENAELERVAVNFNVVDELGMCLRHPELLEKTLKLREIEIRGLDIFPERMLRMYTDPTRVHLDVFIDALGSRRDAGQSVPKVSLRQCGRVPRKTYEKLCGIVGEVAIEYADWYEPVDSDEEDDDAQAQELNYEPRPRPRITYCKETGIIHIGGY